MSNMAEQYIMSKPEIIRGTTTFKVGEDVLYDRDNRLVPAKINEVNLTPTADGIHVSYVVTNLNFNGSCIVRTTGTPANKLHKLTDIKISDIIKQLVHINQHYMYENNDMMYDLVHEAFKYGQAYVGGLKAVCSGGEQNIEGMTKWYLYAPTDLGDIILIELWAGTYSYTTVNNLKDTPFDFLNGAFSNSTVCIYEIALESE